MADLSGVSYIEKVKIELDTGTTETYDIIAKNVRVEREVIKKSWTDALGNRKQKVKGYHLLFTIQADDMEIEDSGGSAFDAREIQYILDEADNTNYIYPDATKADKFAIIGDVEGSTWYQATDGVRDDRDLIQATTSTILDSTDITYFIKQ